MQVLGELSETKQSKPRHKIWQFSPLVFRALHIPISIFDAQSLYPVFSFADEERRAREQEILGLISHLNRQISWVPVHGI